MEVIPKIFGRKENGTIMFMFTALLVKLINDNKSKKRLRALKQLVNRAADFFFFGKEAILSSEIFF